MATDQAASTSGIQSSFDEHVWHNLYQWLFPLVSFWVYSSGVLSWRAQYAEIAEEITQEAVLRTFSYVQRAHKGEGAPVVSLKALCRVIARNHFEDRRKKDYRLIHTNHTTDPLSEPFTHHQADPSQIAIDQLTLDATIMLAARIVARFPQRQRSALLTDLANITPPDEQPSLLEQALSNEGVHLRDYHRPLPSDQAERGRYATLLCIAYKRLRNQVHI